MAGNHPDRVADGLERKPIIRKYKMRTMKKKILSGIGFHKKGTLLLGDINVQVAEAKRNISSNQTTRS